MVLNYFLELLEEPQKRIVKRYSWYNYNFRLFELQQYTLMIFRDFVC